MGAWVSRPSRSTPVPRGQPAHALNEAALDLAQIDGRVQRAARIMENIGRSTRCSPVSVSITTSLTAAP
jgi:hypothetical protein